MKHYMQLSDPPHRLVRPNKVLKKQLSLLLLFILRVLRRTLRPRIWFCFK